MKSYIKSLFGLFILISVLAGSISCNKFLDRKPLTATLDDVNGVLEQQALGLYVTLRGYDFAGLNSLPWIDFNSIRGDDAAKGSSSTDGAEINAEFDTYQYTKDDWATDTYWNDHYHLINQANTLLYFADSLKQTDETSLRNVGEAYFFRAYSYFELVKAYGEVPLINFYIKNAADGLIPKSSVDAIYAQIDKDLDTASQYLPDTWVNSATNQDLYPGRINKAAANTLWAQTYLFRNQWSKVVQLCNEVISNGKDAHGNPLALVPNFPDIWKDGVNGIGKNSTESIFEIQATVGQNGVNNYGSPWATSQQVRVEGAYPDQTWNLGWGWNEPTDSLVHVWDSIDPRRNQTILFAGRSDGGPAEGGYGLTLPPYVPDYGLDKPYYNKKVYSDPAMRAYTGHLHDADWVNHRVMRYADVLLMLAEASNELGDGATAEARLEQVRARARNSGTNPNALPHIAFQSQSQMRQAIKDERLWEFAMEGYRFYDLVRWGDAQSVLGHLGYTPRCQYYPIPQPALNLNPQLVQNPAW
jgi:hypothetical protein